MTSDAAGSEWRSEGEKLSGDMREGSLAWTARSFTAGCEGLKSSLGSWRDSGRSLSSESGLGSGLGSRRGSGLSFNSGSILRRELEREEEDLEGRKSFRGGRERLEESSFGRSERREDW